LSESVKHILEKDSRYKFQAYAFVLAALEVARLQTKKTKHVTGLELLEGVKSLAQQEFGLMAKTVFESWGIKTTDDVGEIVFNLIEEGLLSKTDEDKKEDFHNVYDFNKVFNDEYPFFDSRKDIEKNK